MAISAARMPAGSGVLLEEVKTTRLDSFTTSLFDKPKQYTEYGRYSTKKVNPLGGLIVSSTSTEFELPALATEVYLLETLLLEVHVKMVNKRGLYPAAQVPCAPINNIMHSLIQKVDIYVNNVNISGFSNNYPFKAYLSRK